MEEGLYRQAVERGITLVTLSQHMTLPEFHPGEILIGENERCGWVGRDVDTTQVGTQATPFAAWFFGMVLRQFVSCGCAEEQADERREYRKERGRAGHVA